MSDKSAIEWTDATWNPVHGCSKVSAGCTNCYAEKVSHRFGFTDKPWNAAYAAENVQLHPERLEQPLKWKRPRRIFVNSMSDLFHEQVPDNFIRQVFQIMGAAERHTFQVLTKRPERMQRLLNEWLNEGDFATLTGSTEPPFPWPNVWLGVSVENQQTADERIPLLLQTPAAVRFLSCEPLLGHVDLDAVQGTYQIEHPNNEGYGVPAIEGIDWVIVGGESGPNARPMHPDWARDIRDQCVEAGLSFFFKQWGEWLPMFEQPWESRPKGNCRIVNHEGGEGFHGRGAMWVKHVGKKNAGRLLDGRTWDEYPVIGGVEVGQ